MLESPKTRFQKDKKAVEKLADLVASGDYLKAVDAAFAQMIHALPEPKSIEEAASHIHKVNGALYFIRTFADLGEIPEPVTNQPITKNLNWNA